MTSIYYTTRFLLLGLLLIQSSPLLGQSIKVEGPQKHGFAAKLSYFIQSDLSKWSLSGKLRFTNTSEVDIILTSLSASNGVMLSPQQFDQVPFNAAQSLELDYVVNGVVAKSNFEFVPEDVVISRRQTALKINAFKKDQKTGELIPVELFIDFEFIFKKHDLKGIDFH